MQNGLRVASSWTRQSADTGSVGVVAGAARAAAAVVGCCCSSCCCCCCQRSVEVRSAVHSSSVRITHRPTERLNGRIYAAGLTGRRSGTTDPIDGGFRIINHHSPFTSLRRARRGPCRCVLSRVPSCQQSYNAGFCQAGRCRSRRRRRQWLRVYEV